MAYTKLLVFLYFLNITNCDWVADWMGPVQTQLRKRIGSRRMMDEDVMKMVQIKPESNENTAHQDGAPTGPQFRSSGAEFQTSHVDPHVGLKAKLENTLTSAENLIEKLEGQIYALEKKERMLKDAIANGRLGVSTVTVMTVNNRPMHTYFIRDGVWSVCNGMVQYPLLNTPPSDANNFNEIFAAPRCIGQEVLSSQDPCVFNSVVKYETIPERRKLEYIEDDFFCLKPSFNKSLERYHSVPKIIINTTCQDGVVRSLQDNLEQCGQRILSDYTYYPNKAKAAPYYPLEYCAEKDGACKLIVAWQVSNVTVENFELLRNDANFKKFFIKPSGPYIEHIL